MLEHKGRTIPEASLTPTPLPDTSIGEPLMLSSARIPRYLFWAKHLILNEEIISEPTKAFARSHVQLLVELVKVFHEESSSRSWKLQFLEKFLDRNNFLLPTHSDLAELKDILSEIQGAPPPLLPKDVTKIHDNALEAIKCLHDSQDRSQAWVVYLHIGCRSDVFILATKYPKLLSLFGEVCSRTSPSSRAVGDFEMIHGEIEKIGLRTPTKRTMRLIREWSLTHNGGSGRSYTPKKALLRSEQKLVDALCREFGVASSVARFATESPSLMKEYVELTLLNPESDSDSHRQLLAARSRILHHGVLPPRPQIINICKEIIDDVYAPHPHIFARTLNRCFEWLHWIRKKLG